MAYTEAELAALKRCYASGTLEVSYEGKTIKYDSAKGLLERIRVIEAEMAAAAGRPRAMGRRTSFSRV